MLQDVDSIKFCMLFAGTLSRLKDHRSAYTGPIDCPSLHFIGEAGSAWIRCSAAGQLPLPEVYCLTDTDLTFLCTAGEKDFLKSMSECLAEIFTDAEVIRHARGHVVPPLPAADVQRVRTFLDRISIAELSAL